MATDMWERRGLHAILIVESFFEPAYERDIGVFADDRSCAKGIAPTYYQLRREDETAPTFRRWRIEKRECWGGCDVPAA